MKVRLIALFLALSACIFAQSPRQKNGAVSDKETAIKTAEAALVPVYGKKQIESEKPLEAELKDNVWTVHGTLHCTDGNGKETDICAGGVAIVKIAKSNGRIISMTHEQ